VAFYNQLGTVEAIKWTRLTCHSFAVNAVRLQFHAPLVDNPANFMRTLAMPKRGSRGR
jgi:hypothetical protein